ncbi:uncharacterized protein LOC113789269 [Dermatophagoides pteronyssinus]|uniref:uncharacterized protein LOC113789269 n=1 Tax=Dermatophagoides pteronyssinus TaxID=6956 RepID=UPI003F66D385
MMTMKLLMLFVLILPILMVKHSFAIDHSKSREIVARIDLIKVPNINLWLPRLSLINCYAWWLDYKLFDSTNIEIHIPIALQRSLNFEFLIWNRPFYLYELKYHYQIYLSSLPSNLKKYLEQMDHCSPNHSNMAINSNIEQLFRIQIQKLQSYVERNNQKLREHIENDLDGMITEIINDLMVKMKNLNETQQKFVSTIENLSKHNNIERKMENFPEKIIRKNNQTNSSLSSSIINWFDSLNSSSSSSSSTISMIIISILFSITALLILIVLITFVLFYFRFLNSSTTILSKNNCDNV